MSTHFDQRLYSAVDAADKESCRPDFAVALYPGHLSLAADSIGRPFNTRGSAQVALQAERLDVLINNAAIYPDRGLVILSVSREPD